MHTHLRLHKERPAEQGADGPPPYRFPEAMAAARRTLVAGVVNVPATPESPVRPKLPGGRAVLARIDKGRAAPIRTEDLMSQVERTLDDMQAKIDRLNEDADKAYRFPAPMDDRPRAA